MCDVWILSPNLLWGVGWPRALHGGFWFTWQGGSLQKTWNNNSLWSFLIIAARWWFFQIGMACLYMFLYTLPQISCVLVMCAFVLFHSKHCKFWNEHHRRVCLYSKNCDFVIMASHHLPGGDHAYHSAPSQGPTYKMIELEIDHSESWK